MRRSAFAVLAGAVAMVFVLSGRGQENNNAPGDDGGAAPQVIISGRPPGLEPSLLEHATLVKGMLTRGFTEVGTAQGEFQSSVTVSAVQLKDVSDKSIYGLQFRVRSTRAGRGIVCDGFVDEKEIDPLNDHLAALAKMDRSTVRLSNFDSRYRVPGGLEVANLDSNGTRIGEVMAVQVLWPSDEVVWSRAHFPVGRLEEVRRLIASAKDALEQAKSREKPD